jgi:hypothetical protein
MYRDGSTISLLPYPQTQVCELYILQVAVPVVMKKYRILEKSVLCVPGSQFSTLPVHSYRYTAGFVFFKTSTLQKLHDLLKGQVSTGTQFY